MATTLEVLNAAQLAFWANRPTATLTQTSGFSTPNGASPYTPVAFNSSTEDNWGGHSNSTNNTRYTIPVAGTYRLAGMVTWATNGTGIRAAEFWQNGSVIGANGFEQIASSNFSTVQLPAFHVVCAVGDYLELAVIQTGGTALATVIGGTYLSVEFLHY